MFILENNNQSLNKTITYSLSQISYKDSQFLINMQWMEYICR